MQHLCGGRAFRRVEDRRSGRGLGIEIDDAVVDAEQRDVVIAFRLHQVGRAFDAQVAQYDLLQCPFGLEVLGHGDRRACRIVRVEFQIACDGDSCVRRYRVFARYEIDGLVLTVGCADDRRQVVARTCDEYVLPGSFRGRECCRGDLLPVFGVQRGGVFGAGSEAGHRRRTCGDFGRRNGNPPFGRVGTLACEDDFGNLLGCDVIEFPANLRQSAHGVGREVGLRRSIEGRRGTGNGAVRARTAHLLPGVELQRVFRVGEHALAEGDPLCRGLLFRDGEEKRFAAFGRCGAYFVDGFGLCFRIAPGHRHGTGHGPRRGGVDHLRGGFDVGYLRLGERPGGYDGGIFRRRDACFVRKAHHTEIVACGFRKFSDGVSIAFDGFGDGNVAFEIFIQGVFEPVRVGRAAPRYVDVFGIGGDGRHCGRPQQAAQRGVVNLDAGILAGAESCRQRAGGEKFQDMDGVFHGWSHGFSCCSPMRRCSGAPGCS